MRLNQRPSRTWSRPDTGGGFPARISGLARARRDSQVDAVGPDVVAWQWSDHSTQSIASLAVSDADRSTAWRKNCGIVGEKGA